MEKEFVPYAEALALKELGFDEITIAFYSIDYPQYLRHRVSEGITGAHIKIYTVKDNEVLAPTFSQAFRWFREKYGLHPSIESYNQDENGNDIEYTYTYCVVTNKNLPKEWNKFYNTYEQAELACLRKLIEIVKSTL